MSASTALNASNTQLKSPNKNTSNSSYQTLSSKLQQRILSFLDFHSLLQCRLVSKSWKKSVDKLAEVTNTDRNLVWNPYFTVRRYFDINSHEVLGLIRLQCLDDLKKFVEENSQKVSRKKSAGRRSTSSKIPVSPTKRKPFIPGGRAPSSPRQTLTKSKGASSKLLKPSSNSTGASKKEAKNSNPSKTTSENHNSAVVPSSSPPRLFPKGSLHIRRRLDDYEDEKTKKMSVSDNITEIIDWTTRLVKEYGSQITSFTLDAGKRKGSEVTFAQLRIILSHLPNLVFLGVTSGDYEHHSPEDNSDELGFVQEFLPLPNLKYVWLGYDTTYHLQMDIFNAFNSQLKRFICSRYGYFFESSVGPTNLSTINSLQKLLDYAGTLRQKYPNALESLEELKVPIISTQNLMKEVELVKSQPDVTPIQWSNLKRLSLFYMHHATFNDSCLADLWSFLNVFSGTLEELCLDFQGSLDFLKWLYTDSRPLEEGVFRPCPKVRKLCLSTIALLGDQDMVQMVAAKFPNLEILTFFNWWVYYAEANQNGFQGVYSDGPKIYTVNDFVARFWEGNANLQRASVRISTWKNELLYERTRDGTRWMGLEFPMSS